MATISEDYVSFETAKLLKDKHFNGQYHMYYVEDGKYKCDDLRDIKDYAKSIVEFDYLHKTKVPAPTLQMAMKWLREVHGLHISVDVCPIYGKVKDEEGRNTCGLLYWHYMASGEWINDKYNPLQKAFVVSEKSYKKAIEAALKHCLENLI